MSGSSASIAQKLVQVARDLLARLRMRRTQILLRYGCVGFVVGACLGGLLGAQAGGWGVQSDSWARAAVGSIAGGLAGLAVGLLVARRPLASEVTVVAHIEVDGEPASYAPGDMIRGYARLRSDGRATVSSCTVSLLCSGRYCSDHLPFEGATRVEYEYKDVKHHAESIEVAQGVRLRPSSDMRFQFELMVPPDGMPTCIGFGVRITWSLMASVEGSVPIADAREQVFVESVPAANGSAVLQSQTLSDAFLMQLTLRGLVYAEGEYATGQVQLTASEPTSVSELCVMLLRVEYMDMGEQPHAAFFDAASSVDGSFRGDRREAERGTTYVWIEHTLVLAKRIKVAPQMATTLSFRLPIARSWRPSANTDEGLVKWRVAAVASRSGHPECRTGLNIVVHTATPRVARTVANRSRL